MKIDIGENTCIYDIHYTGIGMYYIIFIKQGVQKSWKRFNYYLHIFIPT